MAIINETMNYTFKDYRDENELEGVVLIYAKSDNKWIGVFRYELLKEDGKSKLTTKVAKLIPLDPMIAYDEQFKYEFSYFTNDLFAKSFGNNVSFSIPQNMTLKVKGYYTQPELDENGKPMLDDNGEQIMKRIPFETVN